ncbi:MAG TPA: RNA methyltransferase [Cyclobacteriaceae bacterium]|nr:RNA methyltransferase [Cyclobacteriaceae bacterium]
MKKLSMHQLGRLSVPEFREREKIPVCILLDNVRSLHNVGSAFRTADAFGLERIILTGITGSPPHREIQKTALGATESVAWEYISDPVHAILGLKQEGYTIVAVEQTTESVALQSFAPETGSRYCLIFGNEVDGISEAVITHADFAIEVPQAGTKHSLNISVCLGVVTWEFFKSGLRRIKKD